MALGSEEQGEEAGAAADVEHVLTMEIGLLKEGKTLGRADNNASCLIVSGTGLQKRVV